MKEKKKKGPRFYRTALILTGALWIAGILLTVLGCVLWSNFMYQLTGVSPEFKEPQYWQRFDNFYGKSENDQKTRQTMLAYASLFSSFEMDYDLMQQEEGVTEEPGTIGDFLAWMLFSGYESSFCSITTDLDGNILKGVDTMVVESAPCQAVDKPGEVKICKDQLLGMVDPDQVFTKEEYQKIVDFVHYDPRGMVVADRFAVMGKEDTVYVPLSVSLIDSKGDEKLHLNLDRNAVGISQDQIRNEQIYFHDIRSNFLPNKDYKVEIEKNMEIWMKSVPLDDASVKAAMQSAPFSSKDSALVTESKNHITSRCNTAVFYGKNIRAFCYSEVSMKRPFFRILFTLGGILTGIHLPFFVYFLIRYRQRKKEEMPASKEAQMAEGKEDGSAGKV